MSTNTDILGLDNQRDSVAGQDSLHKALDLLKSVSDKGYHDSIKNLTDTLSRIQSMSMVAEFHLHPIEENCDWVTNRMILEEVSRVMEDLTQSSKSLKNLLSTMSKVSSAKKELDKAFDNV